VANGFDDDRFEGRIKRYVDMPGGGGYGFIDCEDTKLRFSRDVYIHKNQMAGFAIGDLVSFQLTRNNKGEPQARNVMRPEDALLLRSGGQQVGEGAWVQQPTPQGFQQAWAAQTPPAVGAASPRGIVGGIAQMPMAHMGPAQAMVGGCGVYPQPAVGSSLMDEQQARQFQAALRGHVAD